MKIEHEKDAGKDLELVAHTGEALFHADGAMREKFKTTPEGREVAYLKEVLDYYFKSPDQFRLAFISKGGQGQRGVAKIMAELEHPTNQFNSDPDIVKSLKRFIDAVEKATAYNDNLLYSHYRRLIAEIDNLHTTKDIHEFIRQLNMILAETEKRPHTEVAKAVKDYQKRLPAAVALERFELVVLVMKFMLSRLHRPDQNAKAAHIIGNAPISDLDGISAKIARATNQSPEHVKKDIISIFPQEKEDNNMTHLKSFSKSVAEHGKKNIFINLMRAAQQDKMASLVMKACGSGKKVRIDQKTISLIAAAIGRLSQSTTKEKYENEARHEFKVIVETEKKKMDDLLEGWYAEAKHILDKRIKTIEERYAKELHKVDAALQKINSVTEDLYAELAYLNSLEEEEMQMEHKYIEQVRGILAIYKVSRAINELLKYSSGQMDFDRFKAVSEAIIKSHQTKFVVDNVKKLESIAQSFVDKRLPVEQFRKYITDLQNQFIGAMMSTAVQRAKDLTITGRKIDDAVQHSIEAGDAIVESLSTGSTDAAEAQKLLEGLSLSGSKIPKA